MSPLPVVLLTAAVLVAVTTAAPSGSISQGQALGDTPATRDRVSATPVTDAVIDLIGNSCIFEEDNLFLRRLAWLETHDGLDPSTYRGHHGGIWKVDQSMFQATKANTPALQQKYAAIRNAFGIDWMSVRYEDLDKPLYSGLAASLYIFTKGPVPAILEQQGTYAEHQYNARDTAFQYMRNIDDVPICGGDEKPADVAFLLDATTSNTDFNRMRDFVRDVVKNLSSVDRVAVYQFGGNVNNNPEVQKSIDFTSYGNDIQQLTVAVGALIQSNLPSTVLDTGPAVTATIGDAFTHNHARPLASKILILLTDKASRSNMAAAGQNALANGVSVMALGIGGGINANEMGQLVTHPTCRHFVSVDGFQNLTYFAQLTRRFICSEPMIARGMVHCKFAECRNIGFPITYTDTTVIANVTCDDGRVYLSTRMPRPGRGFDDDQERVASNQGPTLVGVREDVGKFIYVDFTPSGGSDPNCVATLSTVHGVITTQAPVFTTHSPCQAWEYPVVNPCQTPGRTHNRFPYNRDQSKFIQCDQQNRMYLTECPPGYNYFDPDCEACLGGPNSPVCPGTTSRPVTHQFCGRGSNPCTRDNILNSRLYWDCPDSEKEYLQCNIWGESYIQSCPQNQVWRQSAVTCEYEPLQQDPCHGGLRYYPYAPDPHIYIDCGNDQVATLRNCNPRILVWDQSLSRCEYPPTSAPVYPLYTQLTQIIYYTVRPTNQPAVTNPPPVHGPGTGPLSNNYVAPCTQANINANLLYHPYPQDRHMYIQCDLWGDAYVMSCQSGFSYDEFSHTCVNGPVEVDPQVG